MEKHTKNVTHGKDLPIYAVGWQEFGRSPVLDSHDFFLAFFSPSGV
jgi:hypothetical protein